MGVVRTAERWESQLSGSPICQAARTSRVNARPSVVLLRPPLINDLSCDGPTVAVRHGENTSSSDVERDLLQVGIARTLELVGNCPGRQSEVSAESSP